MTTVIYPANRYYRASNLIRVCISAASYNYVFIEGLNNNNNILTV